MASSTHQAVVTVAKRAPLEIKHLPTPRPIGKEVLVKALWTASTPLDLHQADGGLLVKHPQVLGDGVAGQVVATGSDVTMLKEDDFVFGFTFRSEKEKAQQENVCAPENLFGKVPPGWEDRLSECVTVPNNFVTAWNTLLNLLGLPLPWPKTSNFTPRTDRRILVWGGSSSVGQYALQILSYYGYCNVITTSSPRNFDLVKEYGVAHVVSYHSPAADLKREIEARLEGKVDLVLDCIGSRDGSVEPIAEIAETGAKVAIMLPVVVRDAADDVEPEYDMDVGEVDPFLASHLQPEIMPTLLAQGVVRPNRRKIVEGATLLERAQKALDILRRKEVSAIAEHHPSGEQVQMNIRYIDRNTVSYNGWTISGYGSITTMTPELNGILGFLFRIKPHLEVLIADNAFFKTSTNIRTVMNKYRQLLEVGPIIVSAERAKLIGTRIPQPRFQCLREDDSEPTVITNQCNTSGYPAIVDTGTERIWVCPAFHITPQYPAAKKRGPTLGADGHFKPADASLLNSVYAYMVLALVPIYNRELYMTYTNFHLLTDMQHAVELSSRQSVLNTESYGFNAGAVQMKCTSFPKTKGRLGDEF
ncbi:MAG: hypothetical protein Q9178_007699 [Gyalolechia marmorata]